MNVALARIRKARAKVQNLAESVDSSKEEIARLLDGLACSVEDIISFRSDLEPLDRLQRSYEAKLQRVDSQLDEDNPKGLLSKLDGAEVQVAAAQEKLDKPVREYQLNRHAIEEWNGQRQAILGSAADEGTIAFLQNQIRAIDGVPARLQAVYEKRKSLTKRIYRALKRQVAVLVDLYSPVQGFISSHKEIGTKFDLNFSVSLQNIGFEDTFLEWINSSKSGPFMGLQEGRKTLQDLVSGHAFDNEEGVISFIEAVTARLRGDGAKTSQPKVNVGDQLKKNKKAEELYDYVYSLGYLQPRYSLRLGDKELRQLSPGERGALLIVFYLLVDRDNKPLLMDQPEHNLDNETVAKLLVPAIREAKQRRQIIIVTHNPILAVVCNADQVIVASLDIKAGCRVEYSSGAIENPAVNKRIVDILEGTMSAFDNRHKKYIRDQYLQYQKRAW